MLRIIVKASPYSLFQTILLIKGMLIPYRYELVRVLSTLER